jgi:hypothetical protein
MGATTGGGLFGVPWDKVWDGATAIGGGALLKGAYDRIGNIGDDAYTRSSTAADKVQGDIEFTGYNVTGPSGGATVDSSGDTTYTLSPDGQRMQDDLLRGARGMFNNLAPGNEMSRYAMDNQEMLAGMMGGYRDQAVGDIGTRQNEIFGQMQAAMQPQQQRDQLMMENRQRAQGRLGMSTGMYGGTGEQFGLDKAQAEADNMAFLQARDAAMGEQRQGADLLWGNMGTQASQGMTDAQRMAMGAQAAGGMLKGAYTPQAAMIDMFNAGSQAYGYEDVARRQGANSYADTYMGGVNAYLGANLGQANMLGSLGSSIFTDGDSFFSGLFG